MHARFQHHVHQLLHLQQGEHTTEPLMQTLRSLNNALVSWRHLPWNVFRDPPPQGIPIAQPFSLFPQYCQILSSEEE